MTHHSSIAGPDLAPLPRAALQSPDDFGDTRTFDALSDPRFDRLLAFARHQLGMPTALISLEDCGRQAFRSYDGFRMSETPRDIAFCTHAITGREAYVVRDAWEDTLFRDNPLVTGAPFIRFYAGLPMVSKAGDVIGVFCMIDHAPRDLDDEDIATLTFLAGAATDVLELNRAECMLATSAARQQAANQSKATFLQSMNHEFRTPLNAILGFSQILRMPSDSPLSTAQHDYVTGIEAAGRTLLNLTKGILTMAQVDDDIIRRSMLPQNADDVLADLYCQYRCMAEVHGIDLQVEESGDHMILAHGESLHTAMSNLLDNALKFTPSGGRVVLGCDSRGDEVRFFVRDTGPGIPPSRQGEVFQSFNRLGREGTAIAGVGLGLAIARRLVHAMHADIGFSSIEGEFSLFWIRFRSLQISRG